MEGERPVGAADITVQFGVGGGLPVAGDWDGDGHDAIGLYLGSTGTFLLKNSAAGGAADVVVSFGPPGQVALAGDWDGQLSKSGGMRKRIKPRRKDRLDANTVREAIESAKAEKAAKAGKTLDPEVSWEQTWEQTFTYTSTGTGSRRARMWIWRRTGSKRRARASGTTWPET